MKLHALMLVAALLALTVGTTGSALAQGVPQYMGRSDNPNGPTVSPYLNLLQQNVASPTNYQSLVKPLINQGDAIRRQGSAISTLQNQVYSGGGGGTGHSSYFMNYSHFYPGARR